MVKRSRLPVRRKRLLKGAVLGAAATAGAVSGLRARRERRLTRAPGLTAPVTIERDRLGVPRIIAATWKDALFGQGFATAEDRLWQMDLHRRAALGRLSEIVGPQTLESDRLMRLLGMPRIARQIVEEMSAEERAAAESYSAGVNHFIAHGALPLEFRATRHRPEPWEPADCVAVFRLLAWVLSGSLDADLTAEQIRLALGQEWAEAIYRGGYSEHEPIIREPVVPAVAGAPQAASPLPVFPQLGASNAWAVSAERSATGGALLANDPHLELRNPSIWHEARIEAPGFRVAGMCVPGIPAVVIGRTPEIAWGVTAALTPQVFLYREELSEDGASARNDGEWQPLHSHDEIIGVKGQADEVLTIRYTPRGPLVSDLLPQPGGQTVSLHWTGMEPGHEIGVLLDAARATTLDEMLPRFGNFSTPPLSVAVADAAGEIAMAGIGRMATRQAGPGLLPPEEFPPRYVPPEEMPLERNPERGWVACANNCLVDERYPHPIHGYWDPGFRYRRIVRELEARELHSPASFRALQLDVRSVHAEEVVPLLVELLDGAIAPWVVDDLRGWDYEMAVESRPALLYEVIYREWTRLALRHRLPEDLADRLMTAGGSLAVPVMFVDRLLRGELPAWIDSAARRELAARAAGDALIWIGERLGPDPDAWTWGALHQLTFKHPLGLLSGPHGRRVNVGPFPVPGSRHTVSPMVWLAGDNFDVVAGPSFRYVVDMKRADLGWITNTLGQSGSPLSHHFRDQVDDYLQGLMHPLWPHAVNPASRRVIEPA